MHRILVVARSAALVSALTVVCFARAEEGRDAPAATRPLALIVTDPLAAPLSCPCVEGYAQRKYDKLAEYLEEKTGRAVALSFANSLADALEGDAHGHADLIIGKDSVVRADAKEADLHVEHLACLTDKDGKTTQTGMVVVASGADAKTVSDLDGYRILFGPPNCDEKHAAPIALLQQAKIDLPDRLETSQACSDGACKVVELGSDARAAAVISSYAAPLLEGCGTIKKGDLRVLAETKPVPFIAAFATGNLSKAERAALKRALLDVGEDPDLCRAIESLIGFVEDESDEPTAVAREASAPASKKK